ncbi:aspartate kinase [Vallitalea okinawensis]|uniref:aspartate kinase n=1 Tax=Vallitalea okinawensis TaxID=2078660 RepID=UPI000CFA85EC|nr:aspartate kinase [Vallitalea okinawensis]
MSIIVQKFGGTSVASDESRERVLDKIIKEKDAGNKVVITVSAMGRKGSPYATDTLISLGTDLKPREMDLLMSCGELISASVVVNGLMRRGYNACVLTGAQAGILTNETYNDANILRVNPQRIVNALSDDIIPVIAGFQGMSEFGNITTLGRGGSDTTAAILAEAISADETHIYTDVDGIMTADPRVCREATVIDAISYSEVFQMADSGAKVIHPRAVEVARRSGIPLYIKNTFSNAEGTAIIHCPKPGSIVLEGNECKLITSIAHLNDRVQFIIEEGPSDDAFIFPLLADKGVSIDIINIFPSRKVFTVDKKQVWIVSEVLEQNKITYETIEDCSKVTIIGERMTGVPGVMARIITSLQKEKIPLLQTADSLTTIACLIHSKDLERAVSVLHRTFDLA